MLLTTQDELSGYEITETLGMVRGNTVRARHIGKDILASF
ncbi:MAG: heavy metal-binding domain-containing protein, partial [PVC group bacterium]